jgi:hypothetical protein
VERSSSLTIAKVALTGTTGAPIASLGTIGTRSDPEQRGKVPNWEYRVAICNDCSRTTNFPAANENRVMQLSRCRRSHRSVGPGLSVLAVLLFGCCAGCHRQYYRKQADCEAHSLIAEKANHVARPPNAPIRVEVDRRSRMFNPFDLDFQPLPLDDPASYQYMQCVDGRRGYPMWEAAGITNTAESPDWWQFLPLDEHGVLVLDAEDAVRIALLHSPEYQFQVEQLYLSALSVSAERFQFDTQFFGGSGASLTADGRRRSGTGNDSTRLELGSNNLSVQRSFATGGQLIAGIANSIVWELSGPNSQSATTILDFTLLQPLLRTAGRDVVLEGLTLAERNLLANVRSFERFRRAFYLNVTIGRPLEGIVQPRNTQIVNVGTIGFGAGGFLGLLQTELQIRNVEENIFRQTENLRLLEDALTEAYTTIPVDPNVGAGEVISQRLQVAQARSRLLSTQSGLVVQQANYQRSLDQFLRTLGLPPYICVRLEDSILDQFELIDRSLLNRNRELLDLRRQVGETNVAILESGEYKTDPESGVPVSYIEWTDQLAALLVELQTQLKPLVAFTTELIENDSDVVKKDIENLRETVTKRRAQAKRLEEVFRQEQESICGLLNLSEIDESIFVLDELDGLSTELAEAYEQLAKRLQSYAAQIEQLDNQFERLLVAGESATDPKLLAARLREEIVEASQDLISLIGDDVLTLQLIQARARTESLLLPEVDIDPETAFQIARKNRRDWANARAALVDSWRLIEVIADDLESDLDVVFSGDVRNVGDNPLDLRSSAGRLRVGLQWDAPITRLLERNAYRTSLINYERTKRDYYQFEDGIWQLMRAEVRQLHANRLTFELGRQAVRIAAEQIELATDRRQYNESRGRSLGPTAARDSIDALSALLDAQNGLLNVFVSYEVVRRGLDFDMGTMELTPDGLWIDPGEFSTTQLLQLAGTTDGGMINRCNDCCLPNMPLPVEPEASQSRLSAQLRLPEPMITEPMITEPMITEPMTIEGTNSGMLDVDQAFSHDAVYVERLPDIISNREATPELLLPEVNSVRDEE